LVAVSNFGLRRWQRLVLTKPYRIRVEVLRLIQCHKPNPFDTIVFEETGKNVRVQWHPPGTDVVLTATGRTLRSGYVNIHKATTNAPKRTADIVRRFETNVLLRLEALNESDIP
jgi:hypothetical protein